MRQEWNIWVLGGDQRQARLAEQLAMDGHTVHAFALERAGELEGVEQEEELEGVELADCVVLPLPLSGRSFSLALLLDRLRPGQVVCAGRVDCRTETMAERRGITLHDYFAREELAVANAVPAALAVEA